MTHEGGGDPRPRVLWRREAAIAATAFVLCLLGGVLRGDDQPLAPPPVAAYLIALASCAVLPVRHRAPLAAMAATTVCGMLVAPSGLLQTPLSVAPAVITAYALAARLRPPASTTVLVVSAALLAAPTLALGALSWEDVSRMGMVAAFPLVAGVLSHSAQNRRAYLAAVEERAWRAEKSRESEARRRVAEERVRIARELHDLVAHQITLANAQATVAAHLFGTRPEQTRRSLDELVETTGHALDELRATVGLLRQSGDAPTPSEPAPGLSRLPMLLESFRRAGLEVSVHQEGAARPLPPGVDLTAYRIVQEALTNVTKHAGSGSAGVRLAWSRDRVTLTVADDGGGGAAGATASTGPAASTGATASTGPGTKAVADRPSGYGLIGMRERATAVGGHLTAGRRPEGGFLVSARLPLAPAKDTTRATGGAPVAEERTDGVRTDGERTDGERTDGERAGGERAGGEGKDDVRTDGLRAGEARADEARTGGREAGDAP